MIYSVHVEVQRIERVFELADVLPKEEEILAHWARYLCVLVAGLIETAAQLVLSEHARTHASTEIASFVVNQMKYQTNLNTNKLTQLLGAFSDQWADDFDRSLTDAQKDAIDSVLANRHNIAHGRPVGISLVRVKDYYIRVTQVLEKFSARVLGM